MDILRPFAQAHKMAGEKTKEELENGGLEAHNQTIAEPVFGAHHDVWPAADSSLGRGRSDVGQHRWRLLMQATPITGMQVCKLQIMRMERSMTLRLNHLCSFAM